MMRILHDLSFSVAQIVGSVIGKTIYRLQFCISVSDRYHNRESNRYMYLFKIHAHVHQVVYKCILLYSFGLQCCYCCLIVQSTIVVALLSLVSR